MIDERVAVEGLSIQSDTDNLTTGNGTEDCVVIHISDLHIIDNDNSDRVMARLAVAIQKALREQCQIPATKILAITGDIIDSPDLDNFKRAREILEVFRGSLGIEQKNVVCIPGNHDARNHGFGPRVRNAPFKYDYASHVYNEACAVSIVGFDSTGGKLARGKISKQGYRQALERLADHRSRGAYHASEAKNSTLGIALVHHHPLPIKEGEQALLRVRNRELFGAEPFLQMDNAGAFLNACLKYELDVVLHGHRHVSKIHRYSAVGEGGVWKSVLVISCPSSTGAEESAAGFNLIVRRHLLPVAEVIRYRMTGAEREEVRIEDLDSSINLTFDVENRLYSSSVAYLANAIYYASGTPRRKHQMACLRRMLGDPVLQRTSASVIEFLYVLHNLNFYWHSIVVRSLDSDMEAIADRCGIGQGLDSSLLALANRRASRRKSGVMYKTLRDRQYRTQDMLMHALKGVLDIGAANASVDAADLAQLPDFEDFLDACSKIV